MAWCATAGARALGARMPLSHVTVYFYWKTLLLHGIQTAANGRAARAQYQADASSRRSKTWRGVVGVLGILLSKCMSSGFVGGGVGTFGK